MNKSVGSVMYEVMRMTVSRAGREAIHEAVYETVEEALNRPVKEAVDGVVVRWAVMGAVNAR